MMNRAMAETALGEPLRPLPTLSNCWSQELLLQSQELLLREVSFQNYWQEELLPLWTSSDLSYWPPHPGDRWERLATMSRRREMSPSEGGVHSPSEGGVHWCLVVASLGRPCVTPRC